ncbi:MAG: cation transporter [Clostridia bacterium]|nr:cation transporter [Clostridia bacterium]
MVNREKTIIRTSIIGVIANIFLTAFKAVIGLLSNSIAITLDAVNNLNDALSSVITIVGTKLAGKKPDKKHPLGYGRIEYLTALIISALVMFAGFTALSESIKKIINPEVPDYSPVSLIILSSAVIVKLILARYVKKVGKKVNNNSLIASASEANFDAILSFSVIIIAIIYMMTKINLEAFAGLTIAVFIIKSGIEIMIDTINDIIGKRTDKQLAIAVKKTICEDPDVLGAFDLYLYNYGPNYNYGSVHVEVDESMTAKEIDVMARRIGANVYEKHGVVLTGIGLYSVNAQGSPADLMRQKITKIAMAHDYAMQVHGFYVDFESKQIIFDIVLSFNCDQTAAIGKIEKEIKAQYPEYEIKIQPDIDITE